MMRIIILCTALLALAGCQSTELTTQEVALIQAQMTRNTLEINCPAGCKVNYRDPRDQVVLPHKVGAAEAFRDVGIALVGQAPVLGMYGLGVRALDSLSDLGVAGFTALTGSGEINNTTHTTTMTMTTTTSTSTSTDQSVGDYSGAASGNSGQQYADTSGRINSDDDYTSTPTVVQPVAP